MMKNTPSDNPFDFEVNRREVPALKTHRMVLGNHGETMFAAGVADMDFKVAPAILSAMQKRLDHGVFGYETVPDGLMSALTNWLMVRHHWQVDATQILRAPNVLNILAISASLFTNPGDGVIVQPPVFFDFFDIIGENNRKLISNPLLLKDGRYVMNFDGLEKLAANPRAKMIYLCNPHNPVGRVWTKDELQQLADICKRHNVLVVSDEIHGDIIFSNHKYTPFASLGKKYADNSIICLSPAKSFNIASCCSAFTVIANEKRRIAFQAENSRLTVNKNNAFASVAMESAYTECSSWLDAALLYIEANLSLVRKYLKEIPQVELIEPDGTFLLWLDFRKLGLTSKALTALLRNDTGWAVTRGEAFGIEGEGFARLNIACTRKSLEEALSQLSKVIKLWAA